MEKGLAAYSDALIFDKRWTNFDSEVFLIGGQSEMMNLDSTMRDRSHTNPVVEGSGSGPMIHNDLNNINNLESRVVKVEPDDDVKEEDFNNCMDQVELWSKRAMRAYKEHESVSVFNQASLQQEINQRDEVIERLQKEVEQNKLKICQLERQLFEKEMLVMGYREQLTNVNVKSEEYRPRLLSNMTYSNNARWSVGGSPVLSTRGHDSAPIEIDD